MFGCVDDSCASSIELGSFSQGLIPLVPFTQSGALKVTWTSGLSLYSGGWIATFSSVSQGCTITNDPACTDRSPCLLTCNTGVIGRYVSGGTYGLGESLAWIVAPTGASGVSIAFTAFATGDGVGVVRVYSCSDAACGSALELGQFSGQGLLPPSQLSVTGSMMVTWSSGSSAASTGWLATYANASSGGCVAANDPLCTASSPCVLTCDSGSIGRFVNGGGYGSNESLAWIVAPLGASAVTLNFKDFETNSSTGIVTVYSCSDAACRIWLVLGLFSGEALPGSQVSVSGVMKVSWMSSLGSTLSGWHANYLNSSAECSEINDASCSVVSPCVMKCNKGNIGRYVDGTVYGINEKLAWIIPSSRVSSVSLEFSYFSTGKGSGLVTIYSCADLTCSVELEIGQFSGIALPSAQVSRSGVLKVIWISGLSSFSSGWLASFESVPTECDSLNDAKCAGSFSCTLTCTPGIIGRYVEGDGVYGLGETMSWILAPLDASAVSLNFSNFNTGFSIGLVDVYSCSDMTCGTLLELGEFSGDIIPNALLSISGVLKVTWTSGSMKASKGWIATFVNSSSTECNRDNDPLCTETSPCVLTCDSGSIGRYVLGSATYGQHESLAWMIQAQKSSSVSIFFDSFSTGQALGIVEVYTCADLSCAFSLKIGYLSGVMAPFSILSKTAVMKVTWTSGSQGASTGWAASFQNVSEPCIGTNDLLCTNSQPCMIACDAGSVGRYVMGGTYSGGENLAWTIAPPGAANVTLDFSAFQTGLGSSLVSVYSCADVSCATMMELGQFSGSLFPASQISCTGFMRVLWSSNTQLPSSGQGWLATFTNLSTVCTATNNLNCKYAAACVVSCSPGTIGRFVDGGSYQRNESMAWILAPSEALTVSMIFTDFQVASQSNVTLFTCLDASCMYSMEIARFSGSTLPPASKQVSCTGYMKVVWKSGLSSVSTGWRATFYQNQTDCSNQIGCSTVNDLKCSLGAPCLVTCDAGTLGRYVVNDVYGYNETLAWTIAPPGAAQVTLSFTNFTTGQGYGTVTVYSCANVSCSYMMEMGQFSGKQLPPPQISSSGIMLVVWKSGSSLASPGWTATFTDFSYHCTATDNPTCTEVAPCTLTCAAGSIGRYVVGGTYKSKESMAWILAPSESGPITLTFTAFATTNMSDFVYVYSCTDPSCDTELEVGRFSGSTIPAPQISSSGVMKVVWRSGTSPSSSGWIANFSNATVPCTGVNNPQCVESSSPCALLCSMGSIGRYVAGGAAYSNNESLMWILAPAGASVVSLEITYLDTILGSGIVAVYSCTDITCTDVMELGQYSGTSAVAKQVSESGIMQVTWSSGSVGTATGWLATFALAPADCSKINDPVCSLLSPCLLTCDPGTIGRSVSGTSYKIGENLAWVLAPSGASAVSIEFTDFNTVNGIGLVAVYSCSDKSCGTVLELGQFSGKTLPPELKSVTSILLTTWSSGSSGTFNGWLASFSNASAPCSGDNNPRCTSALPCVLTCDSGSIGRYVLGSATYGQHESLAWVLGAKHGSSISLFFSSFSTGQALGIVEVYTCADLSCAFSLKIGYLSGVMAPFSILSKTAVMKVTWTSGSQGASTGWAASFQNVSEPCIGTNDLLCTNSQPCMIACDAGSVGRYVMGGTYSGGENLAWTIAPPGAANVTLDFSAFQTGLGSSLVSVYSCADVSCATMMELGQFSGSLFPASQISCTGFMRVLWSSNTQLPSSGQGWLATFTNLSTVCTATNNLNCKYAAACVVSCSPGTIGRFVDGGSYQRNESMAWILAPSEALTVSMIFTDFQVASQSNVTLFTCLDASCMYSMEIARFSGSTLPPASKQVSCTGYMKVVWKSGLSSVSTGWRATFYQNQTDCSNQIGCSTVNDLKCSLGAPCLVTCDAGTLGRYVVNDVYGYNETLAWTIAPPGAAQVTLSFTNFTTGQGYGTVTVYSCANVSCSYMMEMGQFSGKQLPPPQISSSGIMLVVWKSGSSLASPGWTATFTDFSYHCTATDNPTCTEVAPCTLTCAAGSIGRYVVGGTYKSKESMAWIIAPPGASAVNFTFTAFATKNMSDFVSVYSCADIFCSIELEIGQFTGNSTPASQISYTGIMKVVWTSGLSPISFPGWRATFANTSASCIAINNPRCSASSPCTLTCNSGTIGRYLSKGSYGSSENLAWILFQAGAASVTITFTYFTTSSGSDVVSVYECEDNTCQYMWPIGAFSGSSRPLAQISASGVMKVLWASGSQVSVNKPGWTATFAFGGSGGQITCLSCSTGQYIVGCIGSGSGFCTFCYPGMSDPSGRCILCSSSENSNLLASNEKLLKLYSFQRVAFYKDVAGSNYNLEADGLVGGSQPVSLGMSCTKL